MKTTKYFLLFFITLFLLQSCSKNYFTTYPNRPFIHQINICDSSYLFFIDVYNLNEWEIIHQKNY